MQAVENNSGLIPLGRAVLVEHYEPKKEKGLIELPDAVKNRQMMIEQRAIVVAIGPSCWPDEAPRCKVGDKVLVAKMAGYLCEGTADGKQYRLVNDRDIFAGITSEE